MQIESRLCAREVPALWRILIAVLPNCQSFTTVMFVTLGRETKYIEFPRTRVLYKRGSEAQNQVPMREHELTATAQKLAGAKRGTHA